MKPSNEKPNRFPILRERLNLLMRDLDITTTDFAHRVGISRQTMGFYLNGDRIPDSLTIAQICKNCNVSANWLLGLTETRSPDAGLEAIVQYTGLSEANVNHLHQVLSSQKDGLFINQEKASLQLVNDFISFSHDDSHDDIYIRFFQLLKLRESFRNAEARNGGDMEQLIAEGNAQKWGYAVLPVNESIKYYASQLSQALEYAIVEKYAVEQTSQPRGRKETVVIDGEERTLYRN